MVEIRGGVGLWRFLVFCWVWGEPTLTVYVGLIFWVGWVGGDFWFFVGNYGFVKIA